MTTYGFREKSVAVGLRKIYEKKPWVEHEQGSIPGKHITHGFVLRTPPGGIPARAGMTCGMAECEVYEIELQGALKVYETGSGPEKVTVYNPFSAPIAGDKWITAKRSFSRLVVDAEDCEATT